MAKNIHEIEVLIEGKDWADALTKSFNKAVKTAKIDGFREGKAPRDMFEKKYGKESLYMDAIDFAMPIAYTKALDDNKLVPIMKPTVDIKHVCEEHAEFIFVITTKPEVKLGNYKKLGVEKPTTKVTAEEIEKEIENIKVKYAELVIKDAPATIGDTCVIDFEGFKDGVPFEGGKGTNYALEIGSKTFIPGFEEGLIAKKSGDEVSIDVTFPEDYHSEDLKGKLVTFKVKVNEVKERTIPELNEELFLDLGLEGVKTVEELKKVLEENITARKENDSENKYVDDLLKAASANTAVEIPEELVNEELERMVGQYGEQLQMQGISLDQFYKLTNSTEEQLKEQMKTEANSRVLYRFMLEEIAIKENVEISDEDADNQATILAEKYDVKKDEFLTMFGGMDMIKYDMKMRKAVEVLKNNN